MAAQRDQLKKDIGARIFALRSEKKLTQAQLTERISVLMGESVGKDAVGRWEDGENLPGVDALLALAAELGTSLEELVMGEEAFADRVVKQVLARVEPRIERLEKNAGF